MTRSLNLNSDGYLNLQTPRWKRRYDTVSIVVELTLLVSMVAAVFVFMAVLYGTVFNWSWNSSTLIYVSVIIVGFGFSLVMFKMSLYVDKEIQSRFSASQTRKLKLWLGEAYSVDVDEKVASTLYDSIRSDKQSVEVIDVDPVLYLINEDGILSVHSDSNPLIVQHTPIIVNSLPNLGISMKERVDVQLTQIEAVVSYLHERPVVLGFTAHAELRDIERRATKLVGKSNYAAFAEAAIMLSRLLVLKDEARREEAVYLDALQQELVGIVERVDSRQA
jgi:hypothetical protein